MHQFHSTFALHFKRSVPVRCLIVLGTVLMLLTVSAIGCKRGTAPQSSVAVKPAGKKKPAKKKTRSFPIPGQNHSPKAADKDRQEIADDLFDTDELAEKPENKPRNDAKLAKAGIRKISGRHLTLYTDLPISESVDQLPAIFDLAVPQWAEYFAIDSARLADWHLTGYLIRKKQTFVDQGLLPASLPAFDHGYQLGKELWLYEQPSPYYRRHLLLHEGTHGFMAWFLGGAGPPWYMEGTAELLATHLWQDGKLQLRYMPRTKEEVPYWGRIKIIKDRFAAGNSLSLSQILHFGPIATSQVDGYAWCWAAAVFLDTHPEYQQKFRELKNHARLRDERFSQHLQRQLVDQWTRLVIEWQLFIGSIEYGHDIARDTVQFFSADPSSAQESEVTIAADRGWQSTGYRLEAGKTYLLKAKGRYQVAQEPKIWWCEPGGVTIRYYRGKPLGMLLAMLIDQPAGPGGQITISRPIEVALSRSLTPRSSGTLFLRINDSPASLADNAGTLTVQITEK